GIRSLIGFGNLVGSLSHSVLYLQGVLPQHSPSSDFGENQLSRGLISLSLLLSIHLKIFQHLRVRSSTACYCSFNLLKSRSPPLRVYCPRLGRAIGTRFPFASTAELFRLAPRTITRRLIMQKASSHPANEMQKAKCRMQNEDIPHQHRVGNTERIFILHSAFFTL